MIKSKKLSKNKAIKHGFFNSIGGVSKNIYKSLNCGPGSNDNSANVKKNLNIVRKKISKSSQNIFLLNQIHSNKFVFIDNKYKSKIKNTIQAIKNHKISNILENIGDSDITYNLNFNLFANYIHQFEKLDHLITNQKKQFLKEHHFVRSFVS